MQIEVDGPKTSRAEYVNFRREVVTRANSCNDWHVLGCVKFKFPGSETSKCVDKHTITSAGEKKTSEIIAIHVAAKDECPMRLQKVQADKIGIPLSREQG